MNLTTTNVAITNAAQHNTIVRQITQVGLLSFYKE